MFLVLFHLSCTFCRKFKSKRNSISYSFFVDRDFQRWLENRIFRLFRRMSDTSVPPILPDIDEELRNYIVCIEKLPIHNYERNQEFWPREPNPMSLFFCEESPLCTTLKVQRDPNSGEILEYVEVPIQTAGATAKNSMSLSRAPAPPSETVRGSVSNFPFWPGGFPEPPVLDLPKHLAVPLDQEMLFIAPGFTNGLLFEADGCTVKNESESVNSSLKLPTLETKVVSLKTLVEQEQISLDVWKPSVKENKDAEYTNVHQTSLPEEEEILPKELPVLKISETVSEPGEIKGTEWAVLLDSSKPVKDFEKRIPELAHKFNFELDPFQKLAILQLEQHNHVFVAAHTSAGKTVVAEYAIALSQKHMTRTIYTSPIKALSNQKYRDFKQTFKDVGLITGDFQINQTASCLIMTTEILRSMLYCGSDVTRDLEYVIFDEVHYINDKERGHVWEQVLILLPSHVCVILLSATAPNTIKFADWLGSTYQKKVYVISTSKRPVPLQHYLYTGKTEGRSDDLFMILDDSGFSLAGYHKAEESLTRNKHEKPHQEKDKNAKIIPKKEPYRPGPHYTLKQEMTMWYKLIPYLSKKELMPAVVFIFSRAKCDTNAEVLTALDLTTEREKSLIQMFFDKCVKTLKEPDRNIPQIYRMKEILRRGIGVHHSGILPIIKEMVEMLFQRGLLKLLFATETFAMGVNMPARTVIFDSINKHDGRDKRNLLPAEYIQMAGRAGRRGLDKAGTVIILCKGQAPSVLQLKDMMLGKPSPLTSQFRLTYGMVLSLLRVERLTVEGMMSRSFGEADHQKTILEKQAELKKVEEELKKLSNEQFSSYLQPLTKFYDIANTFLQLREKFWNDIISHPKVSKVLAPGRILQITHRCHINKLGLLLSITRSIKSAASVYKVLILTDENDAPDGGNKLDIWYKMLALAREDISPPIGTVGHQVLSISAFDVFEISSKCVKVDTDLIVKDWGKRQIERFRNDPPGQTCQTAVQELLNVTSEKLEFYNFIDDLKVNDQQCYENLRQFYKIKDNILDYLVYTRVPNFEHQFSVVFERKYLEDRLRILKHEISDASMLLYPEYEKRITLLQQLKYVDSQNRVELKGKVACEMGMNELLITELVMRNILTKLQPAEVASLLSALVSKGKKRDISEEELEYLPGILQESIKELKSVHEEISSLERQYQITEVEFSDKLNFDLAVVVYEWASAKPFAEIMTLTDYQEGIIVRCIQQLNETVCDVRDAARIIGDPALQNKMEETSAAIKRDIVFAASLYTQNESV